MSRESEFLLIDVSNSYTKLALASHDKLGRVRRVPTGHLSVKTLHELRFKTAVISSVVPEKTRLLRRFLKNQRVVEVTHRVNIGVGIDYPKPQTIGEDRLANAASATALYGAPVVVVDFGTAVTFDIISRGRKYLGGVIAPGLQVMTDYLYQRTALLPHINLSEPVSAIGKSTREAMMAGAVYGYRGLVRQIISQIRAELGVRGKMPVVATGGYAELIAADLPEIDAVHPNLTLEGLRIIGTLNA
jgi:type III pantothenate kinase